MKQALLIFVRQPIPGKVKTRLAKTLGDAQALAVYQTLLQHTHTVTHSLSVDKYVFYADDIAANDIWEESIFGKEKQVGDSLGQRMQAAFALLFDKGYQQVCIIGSDCFELTTSILQQAFSSLQQYDVVLGPSSDGGYYLLGMKSLQPKLFANIAWSTPGVMRQTMDACNAANSTHILLPVLNDIDTEEDWRLHQHKNASA